MQIPNSPSLTGSAPAAPAVGDGAPQVTGDQVTQQVQPEVQVQPNPHVQAFNAEAQVSELRGQLQAMYQLMQQGMQQPAQPATPAPVVPSLDEAFASLPDQLTAEPAEFRKGLQHLLDVHRQNVLAEVTPQLQAATQFSQQFEQQRAQAKFASEIRQTNPALANVPDYAIIQYYDGLRNNPVAFHQWIGSQIASQFSKPLQPVAPQPQPTLQPSPAQTIPQGPSDPMTAQLKTQYTDLFDPMNGWKLNQLRQTEEGRAQADALAEIGRKNGWAKQV